MKTKHHLYIMHDGRINMCALTTNNIDHIAQAIHDTERLKKLTVGCISSSSSLYRRRHHHHDTIFLSSVILRALSETTYIIIRIHHYTTTTNGRRPNSLKYWVETLLL
uniref:Uncharacterized protein n=1 Tax=Schistosoma haematobium TaxID=6185 RepID=A0A095BUD7_SCHHA